MSRSSFKTLILSLTFDTRNHTNLTVQCPKVIYLAFREIGPLFTTSSQQTIYYIYDWIYKKCTTEKCAVNEFP